MKEKVLLHFRMLICLAIGSIALLGIWWTSVKGTELEEVDLSRGVTYEESHINLNGNSVIMKESVNSTDTNQLCNIYLDTNRNGVVDEGEEQPVSIDGDIDIHSAIPIYGIYKQRSVTPLSITVLDGVYAVIYGVYDGELDTGDSEENACRINVQEAQITGCVSAARNSKIAAASTAVDVAVTGGIINVVQGVVGGQIISGSSQTAVQIAITGNSSLPAGGVFEGVSEGAKIEGDIAIKVSPDTTSEINYLYVIKNGVTVEGSVDASINHLSVKKVAFSAYTGCNVTGGMTFASGSDTYFSQLYLIEKSNVGGDVSASIYGKMQQEDSDNSNTQIRLLRNGIVEGNVDIDLKDGLFGQIYAVENANVKGNLDLFFEAGTYTSFVWAISNSAAIDGDVTMSSGKETVFTSDFKGCIGNSTIGGDVTVDIYNKNTNINSSNTFQPISDATVAGKTNIKLHGGAWERVYGIGGSSGSSPKYLDDCRVEFTNVKTINKIEGISYASITGNATVILTGCESSQIAIRGIDNCTISGDVVVTATGSSAKNDSIYGVANTTVLGNATVNISNVTCSKSYPVYGLYTVKLGGSTTVEIEDCTVHSVYGVYEMNSVSEDCDTTVSIKNCTVTDIYGIRTSMDETITGITDVSIENCTVSDTAHGIYYPTCVKDVTIKTANNQMKNFIGIYSSTVPATATIKSDGDNRDTASEGYYYGLQYGKVKENITVTTTNCQYGDYKAVHNCDCYANARITIDSCTFTGSIIHPFNSSAIKTEDGEVTILCRDTAFTSEESGARISNSNSASVGTITMTIEDSCTITDAYELWPLYYGSGNALLTYQNDYYYAGSYPITKDIHARNIYFGKMDSQFTAMVNMMIPEGITVAAEEQLYIPISASLLIEGNLNGTVAQTDGHIYMNGGVMEEEEKMDKRYYPLTLSYLSKGGTPQFGSGSVYKHSLCPNQHFALVGSTPAVTCSAKKGYMLTEVTVTKEGNEPQVLTADDDDNYSFEMEACPAELSVTFAGTQITLDETQASITTMLYKETTKDAPLYDLTGTAITNDGEEGDVTYEIKEGSTLPKELTLEDGKLFGSPTQALEDGKDVVITVTGRNGTTADFTLHITVKAGDEDGTPAYVVPEELTAVYGDTLGDVTLPSDENGAFTWQQEEATPVGDVGEQEFLVTYTPANDNYKTLIDIKVTVTVQKAKAEFTKVGELTAKHKDTLNDLTLPNVENGEYYWVTSPEIKPEDGKTYDLGFRPADGKNYDWENAEGWDEQAGSVIMAVTIKIQHSYGTAWEKDEINHWHACECGKVQEKAAHTWDEGIITKEATEEENGIKEYHCTVCKAVKEEVIPAIGHTHIFKEAWVNDEENHWHECECGEIQGKAAHTWNAGVVTKEATKTEDGSRQYTCTVCGKIREEVIKATGGTGNNPSGGSTVGNPPQQGTTEAPIQTEKQAASEGTILTDSVTKAKYKVISSENEEPAVQYVSSTDAAASAVTIASSVTIDDIDYKITEIADNAFKNNKKLKKVTIADSIVTIGKSAFQGCTALTSVKLGSSVETIKDKAFYGCKKLSTLTLGANVATLGKSVFEGCITLKKVTIPKKVTKIGSRAFYNCKKLVNITIKTTKLTTKNVGSKAFTKAGSSNYKKLKVKVPKSKLKVYKTLLKKRGLSTKAKIRK